MGPAGRPARGCYPRGRSARRTRLAGAPRRTLVAVEPHQGAPPSGRTVVRVLAGPKALVFGIRCEDPDAARIVSFTKERDGDLENEDHVVLVLDPFHDGRSGYVFAVNPGGARYDALVDRGGEKVNPSWDGDLGGGYQPRHRGLDGRDPHPHREPVRFKRDTRRGASTSSAASSACRRPSAGPARAATTRSPRPAAPESARRASPLRPRLGPLRAALVRDRFREPLPGGRHRRRGRAQSRRDEAPGREPPRPPSP